MIKQGGGLYLQLMSFQHEGLNKDVLLSISISV